MSTDHPQAQILADRAATIRKDAAKPYVDTAFVARDLEFAAALDAGAQALREVEQRKVAPNVSMLSWEFLSVEELRRKVQARMGGDSLENFALVQTLIERVEESALAALNRADPPLTHAATTEADSWRSIATAQQDGAWFLAWGEDCGFCVYRMGPGFITGEDPQPTHWQPLPPAPRREEEPR